MIHVVINCCEIRGAGRLDCYIRHTEALLSQGVEDARLVFSGCCMTPPTKRVMTSKFRGRAAMCWTDEIVPLTVSFNLACKRAEAEWGRPEAVVYVDSGMDLTGHPDYLAAMLRLYRETGSVMVSCKPENDDGYSWNGLWDYTTATEPFALPVGKGVNLHLQLFGREVADAYGAYLPDVFAADTSESIYSFMCAALGSRLLVMPEPAVHHEHSMDGASSGFRRGGTLWKLSEDEFIRRCQEGRACGFGYEECCQVLMHRPDKFDSDGNATDPELKPFIRRAMFHSKDSYDYDKIRGTWYFQSSGESVSKNSETSAPTSPFSEGERLCQNSPGCTASETK